MPVRIHVDFTFVLHSHTPLVPQAWCEANLDRLRLFNQWEWLKCNGHGHSISCVKWPLVPNFWVYETWHKITSKENRPLHWLIVPISCVLILGVTQWCNYSLRMLCFIKLNCLCIMMSKQPIELSLLKFQPLSKMLLHSVTPNSVTH